MKRLSLHAKLALGILTISVLPLLLAVALIPSQVERILRRQSEGRLQSTASNLAALTEETFLRHIEGVRLLSSHADLVEVLRTARVRSLQEEESERLRTHFARLLHHFDVFHHGLFLFDAQGAVIAAALGQPQLPVPEPVSVADREYFQRALATRKPVVSLPIASRVGGVPVIMVGAPILDHDGEVLGMIAVGHRTRPLRSDFGRP